MSVVTSSPDPSDDTLTASTGVNVGTYGDKPSLDRNFHSLMTFTDSHSPTPPVNCGNMS